MFRFLRRHPREKQIERLHAAVVAAARHPALYGPNGFPDTFEGRFEALTVHVLLLLRRLRELPPPADDVAQEFVDAVFAHLEVSMRETGVGDMGVPKKMKKLGRAFYDRTATYEAALEERDAKALADELTRRLARDGHSHGLAAHILATADALASQDLSGLLAGPSFPPLAAETRPEEPTS